MFLSLQGVTSEVIQMLRLHWALWTSVADLVFWVFLYSSRLKRGKALSPRKAFQAWRQIILHKWPQSKQLRRWLGQCRLCFDLSVHMQVCDLPIASRGDWQISTARLLDSLQSVCTGFNERPLKTKMDCGKDTLCQSWTYTHRFPCYHMRMCTYIQ